MNEIIQLNSVDVYDKMYGLKTLHSLVSVVDLRKATRVVNHVKMNYGVYALFLKNGTNCTLKYGRRYYDYQEGTIVSFAPGQLVGVDSDEDEISPEVYGLIFHPDLIYGTALGKKIGKYSFFSYEQNEALHLSDQEREIIMDCFHKIEVELQSPGGQTHKGVVIGQYRTVARLLLASFEPASTLILVKRLITMSLSGSNSF